MSEAEWLKSGLPILFLEAECGWPSPRKQRLFAVACCRHIQHLMPDTRWQDCLATAEQCADRRVNRDELTAALAAAQVSSARNWTYAHLLRQCVATAIHWACQTRKRFYAGQVAIHAACAVAYSTLPLNAPYVPPAESRYAQRWAEAEKAEVAAQVGLVHEICGDPFHRATASLGPLPRDLTYLALAAYKDRFPSGELDRSRLAVLSDALGEAGIANADLRAHLRSPGPHFRGCWALDQCLSRL